MSSISQCGTISTEQLGTNGDSVSSYHLTGAWEGSTDSGVAVTEMPCHARGESGDCGMSI